MTFVRVVFPSVNQQAAATGDWFNYAPFYRDLCRTVHSECMETRFVHLNDTPLLEKNELFEPR